MSIQISGSNLTTGFNNTVLSPPYGSISFNGINQTVVTSGTGSGANGTILDITTGSPNWTVECWIYASEHARSGTPQYFLNQGNGQNVLFSILSGDNSQVTVNTNVLQAQFYTTDLGWVYMSSWPTGTISLNTWYHVALCKDTSDGNRYYLYLNGVLVSTTPSVTPTVNQAQPWEFGMPASYITGDPSYAFNGYLSNIRIVKGVALYVPPNITVPTPPLTSTQSLNLSGYNQAITGTQTSLLLTTPNNSSYLTDTSSYAQTVTAVNGPTSSALGPGTYSGSILFNGTNQYLSIARATQFNYSTNDFTWEMWIYPTATNWTSGTIYLMDHGPSSSANQGTLVYYNNGLRYVNYYNSSAYPPATSGLNYPSLFTIGGGTITANTWTHVAVCRQNLVTNMFINGKLVSSGPDPYNFATQSGAPFTSPIVSPASQSVYIGIGSNGAGPFKGNISNVRIVNGVSVYNVGNFTPPVQPLPAVQAPNTIGSPSKSISSNQTSLLVNMPYNNNFLTDGSFNGVTLTQQTTGNYPKSTYTLTSNSTNPFNSNGSIFTPGSIFFNGSSQYLSLASNTAFDQNGIFTWECWFYPTNITNGFLWAELQSGFMGLGIGSGGIPGKLYVDMSSVGPVIISNTTITVNNWYHVALVYDGTNTKLYLNGILEGTYAGGGSASGAPLWIGNYNNGPLYYNGYISNFRIVKGAAVYTQNFIPTSGPFTNNQTFNQSGIPSCPVQSSQTSLLLTTPSNSSYLTDSSTNAFTVTNVGTATSNPFNPFTENYTILSNPGSVSLNGTSQYLYNSSAADTLAFGTGDFTVEYWVYYNSLSLGYQHLVGPYYGSSNCLGFGAYGDSATTGTLYFSTQFFSYFTDIPITTGRWLHVAFVRTSGSVTAYVNGIGSTPVSAGVNCLESGVTIGGSSAGVYYSNAYLSNLRVVKGLAVYSSNFVPPAGPLNNSQAANQSGAPSAAVTSTQTSLLLNTAFGTNFLVDSSINNLKITNVGTATSATLDPFVF